MKSATSGQENSASVSVFIWTETFLDPAKESLPVHGFPSARMFAFLFWKTTCSRCVELTVALPHCIRKVTLHCIPATQHDEGNQKWGACIYGTFNRCNSKWGHCVFLKDCWESKLCFRCLPESSIMSLSSLISRYSHREAGYRLCIVDDYMNLDFFFLSNLNGFGNPRSPSCFVTQRGVFSILLES